MSIMGAHWVHQPCHIPRASTNKVCTRHHRSHHHPTPFLFLSQTPKLSKDSRGSRLTKPLVLAATETQHERPPIRPLIDLLKSCEQNGSLKQANCIHGHVLKFGFSDRDNLVFLNHVAHVYSKCMDYNAARKVFDNMPTRNAFSWTVMIVASNEHGYYRYGLELFCMMLDRGVLLDGFAFSAVLQSCVGLDSIEFGEMVHAQVVLRGFLMHAVVGTSLLNFYAKLRKCECSVKVFNNMPELNDVSWNAMISGFTSNGLYQQAFDCFFNMIEVGVSPNKTTFLCVSRSIGQLGDINKCHEVHRYASELGLDCTTSVGTALIDMYSKCGFLSDARVLFDSKFASCLVNAPWNAMITGYSQAGCHLEALEMFARMCQNDVKPDLYTFCCLFNSIAALKCPKALKETHGVALKGGFDAFEISVSNALTDAYVECESLEAGEKVFYRMDKKDIVSWTTMVTAYCQYSEWWKALGIFSQMRNEGFAPNHFTFSSVITACGGLCLLEFGQQIHGLICKARLETDSCIESALIDMYSKCGNLVEAKMIFERISNPDTVTWTAIISTYAQHGLVEDALKLFKKMEQSAVKVNAVTLLCILFACSHGGMVEDGLRIFNQMESRYGVVPKMEHYACVVDLLGRVGHLNEAVEFIDRMRIKPDEMVWQALLGACRIHGNFELAETAAQKIISIQPEHSSTYVLLSNTYMESGLHRVGVGLRDVMKERGIRKEPGYSWISVRGEVHKFYARDQQHPQKDKIYTMLEELTRHMKYMHYEPEFSLIF